MDIYKIAKLVEYFNIALGIILAIFVAVVVYSKKWRGSALLSASCVAVFAAFVLEATVFNYPFYLRYFAGPQIGWEKVSQTDSLIIITLSDGTHAKVINGTMCYSNLNMKIASVFADINFTGGDNETIFMLVKYTKEGITREYAKRYYKYLPRENYAPLLIQGNVSGLEISFSSIVPEISSFEVNDIVLNKPIPFYFSGLRVFVASLLLLMLFSLVSKKLRASYWPI
jgi:hypothetical protein